MPRLTRRPLPSVLHKLAEALVALAAIAAIIWALSPPARAGEVDVAIVFVVDVSGSMEEEEVAAARQAHIFALNSPEVLTAIADGVLGRIAVAYVEFGDAASIGVVWTVIDGAESARRFGDRIAKLPPGSYLGGGVTAVGAALLAADDLLDRAPAAPRLVVDVVGDGINSSPPHPELGREAILSRGGIINAMPVLMDAPDRGLVGWYTETVVGGPGHFVMAIAGIDKMPMALRSKIVQELY